MGFPATAQVKPRGCGAGRGTCVAERELSAGFLAEGVTVLPDLVLLTARLMEHGGHGRIVSEQGIGTRCDVPQPEARRPRRRDPQAAVEVTQGSVRLVAPIGQQSSEAVRPRLQGGMARD